MFNIIIIQLPLNIFKICISKETLKGTIIIDFLTYINTFMKMLMKVPFV
jgi:hypothetical protein